MSAIEPFGIAIPDEDLTDLRDRSYRTRWPERECVDDWSHCIPLDYTRELAAYWADEYDWHAREQALNRFDHFTPAIGINGGHCAAIHLIEISQGPRPPVDDQAAFTSARGQGVHARRFRATPALLLASKAHGPAARR